ncbi:hypothetical protein Tco_0889075 [Tanacetum coccineum]
MNAKVDEPKVGDISVVRDFVDVFPEDFSGLPPQRQVEFRIDLVHGATSVAKSPYRLAPLEMQELSEQLRCVARQGFHTVVSLSGMDRECHECGRRTLGGRSGYEEGTSKPRRVRRMVMTIQYWSKWNDTDSSAQSEAFKQENILAERLHGLDQQMERKEDESLLRWMIYLVVLANAAERVRDTIGFEYCLASLSGWTNFYGRENVRSHVLWAEIGESSLTGLELVQETTDKVSPWKGVMHFGKKGKLAPRYVDKTLHFVEEPVEIIDRGVKSLRPSRILIVKVYWNSKRGYEDFMDKQCIQQYSLSKL